MEALPNHIDRPVVRIVWPCNAANCRRASPNRPIAKPKTMMPTAVRTHARKVLSFARWSRARSNSFPVLWFTNRLSLLSVTDWDACRVLAFTWIYVWRNGTEVSAFIKRGSMSRELLLFLFVLVAYIVLNRWLLPKLGVPTWAVPSARVPGNDRCTQPEPDSRGESVPPDDRRVRWDYSSVLLCSFFSWRLLPLPLRRLLPRSKCRLSRRRGMNSAEGLGRSTS